MPAARVGRGVAASGGRDGRATAGAACAARRTGDGAGRVRCRAARAGRAGTARAGVGTTVAGRVADGGLKAAGEAWPCDFAATTPAAAVRTAAAAIVPAKAATAFLKLISSMQP